MSLIKKSFAVVLFVSLISCFVLYRTGFFERPSYTNESETLATNTLIATNNTIEGEKRLIVDLETILLIDTLNLTVKRSVLRKYILEDISHLIIPSSKSTILIMQLPQFASKNKDILKRLKENDVIRVNFSVNRGLESQKSDAALLEALYLIEKGKLKVGSRLERYLDNEKTINLHWKTINNIVTLDVNGTQLDLMANRSDVEDFFKWYDEYDDIRNRMLKSLSSSDVLSSSKSGVVIDVKEFPIINSSKRSESQNAFIEKLDEYLSIRF